MTNIVDTNSIDKKQLEATIAANAQPNEAEKSASSKWSAVKEQRKKEHVPPTTESRTHEFYRISRRPMPRVFPSLSLKEPDTDV